METFFLDIDTNKMKFHQFGNGKHLLLCFHGFGQSGAEFSKLESFLSHEVRIIAPDLPFHGDTAWNSGSTFRYKQLKKILQALRRKFTPEKVSLLGFSMGGRLALSLAQRGEEKIEHLLLAAPEGLRKDKWFDLATRSRFGRQLFKFSMAHPKLIIRLAFLFRKIGWIKPGQNKYVVHLMNDPVIRQRVYDTWNCFRELTTQNKEPFEKTGGTIYLWFGRYDRLIPAPQKYEYKKWAPAKIYLISCGHLLLNEKEVLERIAKIVI